MSRKFDEYMTDKFKIDGERYSLVEPENTKELMVALEIKARIQDQINNQYDEDSSDGCDLLQQQEDYISEYIESLGEFDNTTLANNVVYLLRKNSMRVGELEKILGISTGYISRTIKKDSKKKMSIDIVWKIARLFDTDIRTLTETSMWVSHANTDLLVKFLDKLYKDTKDNYLTWENDGGVMALLDERYEKAGIITMEADEKCVYHPRHMNQEYKWVLYKDIVYIECFDKERDLVIIPFGKDGNGNFISYDFLFIWEDGNDICWQKVFYTSDDPFGRLFDGANKLYELIEASEEDAKLSPNIYRFITQYVEEDRID